MRTQRFSGLLAGCSALTVLLLLFRSDAPGWGWDTHRFMNRKAVYHLPGQMLLFIQDSSFFAQHSVDADARRSSSDTSLYGEPPRHYLDIDDYPDFRNLPRSLDTLIQLYGWERVKANGTLPWATVWTYDSLVHQLARGAWGQAVLTASDLGHYVADAHQPLHVTRNYNGQYTGNYGIHSRYETTMLSSGYYLGQLAISPDSAAYVGEPLALAFGYILESNALLDTILQGDTYARAASGWNGSGQAPASYYAALWERTRAVTLDRVQHGTRALADLWYSAWVDAGLIAAAAGELPAPDRPAHFSLMQNYPNPFNPATTITYDLPVGGTVSLTVFTSAGELVATLAEGNRSAGRHAVTFDAAGLSSGVYFCRLQVGPFFQTVKLVLAR